MTLATETRLLGLATAVADRLAHPHRAPATAQHTPGWRQSLAHGIPGIALLHIELAARGERSWKPAHDWLNAIGPELTAGSSAHSFYGAPGLAHVLACAAEASPGHYQRTLEQLDASINADALRRAAAGQQRIDAGQLPALSEFDAIRGLAGTAGYLLRRDPHSHALAEVLAYLVRLTAPLDIDGERLPGWWTGSAPNSRPDPARFPGGHANFGAAHGIAGVLSALSLAERHGVIVDGQLAAIRSLVRWLDLWQTSTGAWPYWLTRADRRTGPRPGGTELRRPSWCYGTPGIARALQLAALALDDGVLQDRAERTLLHAVTDPGQLELLGNNSLCHGYAGVAHLVARATDDSLPQHETELIDAIPPLLRHVLPEHLDGLAPEAVLGHLGIDPGLLEGAAGIALAVLASATGMAPATSWDSCLLTA